MSLLKSPAGESKDWTEEDAVFIQARNHTDLVCMQQRREHPEAEL